MLLYIVIGCLFIFMGLSIHVCKWYFLISGYNTMPKDKQANVDTEGLGRYMGIHFYINGGMFILTGIVQGLGYGFMNAPAIIMFLISTIYFLFRAQKYDGNVYDKNGKLIPSAWKQFIFPIGIIFAAIVFVAVLFYFSSKPTQVTLSNEGIQIHGMYGNEYSWESIESITIQEDLPTITLRTNGSAIGSSLKGNFLTEEYGPVTLFVDSTKSNFIYLKTKNKLVIFNLDQDDMTRKLFDEMKSHSK